MTFYQQTQPCVTWIEPFETGWQLLGGQPATDLAPKLPHLGLADILYLSSVLHTPRDHRPWGIVSWLADVFCLSRPALYALAQRVAERLLQPPMPVQLPEPASPSTVVISENRLVRTALTATLPGKAALRPTSEILQSDTMGQAGATPAKAVFHQPALAQRRAAHLSPTTQRGDCSRGARNLHPSDGAPLATAPSLDQRPPPFP